MNYLKNIMNRFFKLQNLNIKINFNRINNLDIKDTLRMKNNSYLLDKSIKQIQNENDCNKLNIILECLNLFDICETEIRANAEKTILEIISEEKFIENLSVADLSRLYFISFNLKNISQKEINMFNKKYIDSLEDLITERNDHILILDSLFFPEYRNFDILDVKTKAIEKTLLYFDTYNNDQLLVLLMAILFMKDHDIKIFFDKVDKFINNKVLKKNNFDIDNILSYLQYYMKVLKTCEDVDYKQIQSQKISSYVYNYIEKCKNVELIICIVSNYSHYVEFNCQFLEKIAILLKPKIYDIKLEFLVEFLFILLHMNAHKFKNIHIIKDIINDISILIIKSKFDEYDLSGNRKDLIYFRDQKNKIRSGFDSWIDIRKLNNSETKSFKSFKTIVDRSLMTIPFTLLDNNFEDLYSNYKSFNC